MPLKLFQFPVAKNRPARQMILILLAVASGGGQCINNFLPPSALTIEATPTGCGVVVSPTRTLNWLVKFNVTGGDPDMLPIWSFSDGTHGSGRTVVKAFDTAALESGPGGDHLPVNFTATATVGNDTATRTIGIPMRGTPDGDPDPFGDTCVADEGRSHAATTNQLCYESNPPASGPHYSQTNVSPVAPGFYDEALATERWVHNLEHGTIVLLYDCGGECSDTLKDDLRALFDAVPESARFGEKKMVITRYAPPHAPCNKTPTFPASGPFMAIGWGVQRSFDSLDTDGILAFYARHVDQGPEDEPIPSQ
jgi:hypothetical protein